MGDAMERWSLRFRDDALERAFDDEEAGALRGAVLAPTVVGFLVWCGGGVLDRVTESDPRAFHFTWAVRFGIGAPLIAGMLIFVLLSPRAKRGYQPYVASAIAGLLVTMTAIQVVATRVHGGLHEWTLGYVLLGMTFTIMIAHTVLMLRFRAATAGTVLGVVAYLVAVRSMPATTIGFAMFWLIGATCLGMAGSYRMERSRREMFLQRRLLAEERAKTEALLVAEVRHQVAARSRELAEALSSAEPSSAILSAGERFDGRYRIERTLGAGGMGAVYEVERLTDARRLALKLISGAVSPGSAARFAREAEIGARLHHRNLISIVDVGVVRGTPYLVMELVKGGTLEGQRARFGDAQWSLPILRQIVDGLVELHGAGVIHRDLKPGNVLLDGETAKIADFGISRLDDSVDETGATLDERSSPKNVTRTGALLGTPQYMAPETARGAHGAGFPTDVFAFGVLAYEALTGRAPFATAPLFSAIAGQRLVTPAPIDGVPERVSRALLDCLAESPSSRPTAPQLRTLLA